MSMLIKGMKLPKNGYLAIVPTGEVFISGNGWGFQSYGWSVQPDGQAVELPDHGDLIDADWLKEECKEPEVWWETETQMKGILANAPVVIPAERSEASLCDNCDQRNDKGCCVCKYIKERGEE